MFAVLVNEYKLEFQFRKASKDTEFAWAIIVLTLSLVMPKYVYFRIANLATVISV